MPVLRYIIWVGVTLLAVFFLTDSYLPKAAERVEKPVSYKIAIESRAQGPEALSFSGENRVFPQQIIAEAAPKVEAPAPVRDAYAKLNDNAPQAADIPARSKKVAKRKIRKPATGHARDSYGYSQNVAYHRPFDAPFQRSVFW